MGSDAPQQNEQQEEVLPGEGSVPFPIVGIGASAGGLKALQQFFTQMPADTGMAFVVILHLSPEYESNLAGVLQQTTAMPVTQVTEAVRVEPNHVYVIPPTRQLSMSNDTIQLEDLIELPGRRASVDLFFRTLAETQGRRAAAIVLSGTGADGAVGIKRIKERGGVTLAQDPQEAEFDGMPRSTIATGLVDFVLPVGEMPETLMTYWRSGETVNLPVTDTPPAIDEAEALREVFYLLRTRTGHDFSQYKRPTLMRRIGRRMQVTAVTDLPAYLEVVRTHPEEVQALLRDLLISVTNFFRDREAWLALEAIIPEIFRNKNAGDQVRVWVAGCATGEEAYTMAMLLHEYASTLDQSPVIQIFATDIDEEAIATARQGVYPESIVADVSPERIQRFFVAEQGHYRIKKEIRDLVLFAPHNLLRDPPFSRLDLITCRNLLIYLNRDVQEQVLKLFHFILRPEGYLLLGASESTDGVPGLFTLIDKAQRLYQRRTALATLPPAMPTLPLVGPPHQQSSQPRPRSEGAIRSLSDLHQQLLTRYAPPSVIINEDYDIVYLSRGVGRFLQFVEGEPSHNLLKVVPPNIRLELRTALFTALQQGSSETRRIQTEVDGRLRLVNIVVQPIHEPEWAQGYILVLFNDLADVNDIERSVTTYTEPMVRQLEEELQRTKDLLRTTIEQYETAVEEYKAANEELQAINEELRAATEELETSKEELQSVNEELTTVNQELKHKVEEVTQSNNDLQNLMASTEIGTIFVDRELRIKRYTPSAQTIFNLIPSDVNRPLAHVTHTLDYEQLAEDAARVLERLAVITREVWSSDGRWYLARLLPYRTFDDRIDGVTITFVDISERRQAEEAVRASERRFNAILQQMPAGVMIADIEGKLVFVNTRAAELLGPAYPHAQNIDDYRVWQQFTSSGEVYAPEQVPLARALRMGEIVTGEEVRFPRPDGTWLVCQINAAPIRDDEGRITEAVMTIEEVAMHKHSREDPRRLPAAIALLQGAEHRYVLANPAYHRLALDSGALVGRTAAEVWPDMADDLVAHLDTVYRTGEPCEVTKVLVTVEHADEPGQVYYSFRYEPLFDDQGRPRGILAIGYETTMRVD